MTEHWPWRPFIDAPNAARHFEAPVGDVTRFVSRVLPLVLSLIGALLAVPSDAATPKTLARVHLDVGTVQGAPLDPPSEGFRFLGIPYAAPPVGPLRWSPPAAVRPWKGIRDASRFGPACPQDPGSVQRMLRITAASPGRAYFAPVRFDEDCLSLNVFTPSLAPDQLAPVVVYVHGGGNMEGTGQTEALGLPFSRAGVVVVTINYRLGVLGFLAHPALSAASPHHVSGNYALLDILAALDWVKGHIGAFGGDPGAITVMGESAGAIDIAALITSPRARGRFSRAIIQSAAGTAFLLPALSRRTPFGGGDESSEDDGVQLAHDLNAGDGAEAIRRLRALPPEALLKAAAKDPALQYWPPNIDGWVLPEEPMAAYLAGRVLPIPLLIGSNADESTMFLSDAPPTPEAFAQMMDAVYHAESPLVREHFAAPGASDVRLAFGAIIEADVALSTRLRVEALRRAGVPACFYRFTMRAKGRRAAGGAFHGLEMYFLNEDLVPEFWGPADEADLAFSRQMIGIWTRFIRTGDPNGPGLPAWDCRGGTERVYALGPEMGPMTWPSGLESDMTFFEGIVPRRLESIAH